MDEYLKILLDQIRCKKARPYIQQELQNHIEDQIEANMHAGMDREQAEKEAVRDMGDPVETGISLDSIHKPQIAWKLLGIIIVISIVGILIHVGIARHINGSDVYTSDRYVFHVIIGLAVMMFLYLLDYTFLAKFSKVIAIVLLAVCLLTLFSGNSVNGATVWMALPGGRIISVQALMLFYIPIYGAILYKYHGSGYQGVLKAVIWMVVPVVLVFMLPSFSIAGRMFISMLIMLTIAIKKNWFVVEKKKTICGLWTGFMIMPMAILGVAYLKKELAEYQIERIRTIFSLDGEWMRLFWKQDRLIGKSGADITESLPGFNSDYILTYISSVYGTIIAILLCCILAVLILAVFNTVMNQKNQLGMMMGCGCGMVFLMNFLVNILENLGIFPQSMTFLPLISAGGSYIVAAYGLLGIVLSVYRYKNVYPRNSKIDIKLSRNEIRHTLSVSKLFMCILGGITAVIACAGIYLELWNGYVDSLFKGVIVVLAVILIRSIYRIVYCSKNTQHCKKAVP